MTSNRFPWPTAVLVVPSTALTIMVFLGPNVDPVGLILATPTVLWVGGFLLRRHPDFAKPLRIVAAALGVMMLLWFATAVAMIEVMAH